jgi:hypothetical protein
MKFARKLSGGIGTKEFSVPAHDLGFATFRAQLTNPEPAQPKTSHASRRPVRLRGKFRYLRDHNAGAESASLIR